MKKAFLIFSVIAVLVGFIGCGGEEHVPLPPESPEEPTEPEIPEEPEKPAEPEDSQKGKSIKFSIAINESGYGQKMAWSGDDNIKIFSVSTDAGGRKIVKQALYNVTPDRDDPSKAVVAVPLGALDLRWQNDDEHVFYAVYSGSQASSLSIDGEGLVALPVDVSQTCIVTDDGGGNYTASSDMESFCMCATASCDPQDVSGGESGDGGVVLAFSPIMTALDIVIEGPSDGEVVLTAVSVTAETASEDALNHKFVYDISDGVMIDADKAPDVGNPHRASVLLSLLNDDSENPNSVRLSSGRTLKITALIPPIATDRNRSLTIRPHTAGAGSIQIAHKAGAGTEEIIVPGTCSTVNVSCNKTSDAVSSNVWMTWLDDNVKVSHLSIPGTHDAATKKLSIGQCQSLSIEEQLDMGIRMFDLRPTVKSGGLGNIYHSILDTGVSMDDVMTWFDVFLDENPDEFILAVMRWESERGGTEADYIRCMTEFLAGNSVYQARKLAFKPDLTLGECRGKILLISRTDLSPDSVYETAYTGWNHSNSIREPHDIRGSGGNGKIRVQDMYSRSENGNSSDNDYLAKKRELVRGMMDISAKYHDSGSYEWMINHCSGYTGSSWSPDYKNNAANVHPEIYFCLTGKDRTAGPAGIIMMDYVGSRKAGSSVVYGDLLPQAIIDNNFKY